MRLPIEVRDVTTKKELEIVNLMSKNNQKVEHNFMNDIAIATVSKTHSSIRPVQNVNWGYHDSTLWIKNGLHATFRIVLARNRVDDEQKQ